MIRSTLIVSTVILGFIHGSLALGAPQPAVDAALRAAQHAETEAREAQLRGSKEPARELRKPIKQPKAIKPTKPSAND